MLGTLSLKHPPPYGSDQTLLPSKRIFVKYLARLAPDTFLGRLSKTPKSLPVLMGLALALTGCPEGTVQSVETIDFDEANELFIQPIQVCNDNGGNCANINLFADITRKILEQAQLRVSFLPTNRLNNSRFLTIEDSRNRTSADYEFYELTRTGGAGAFGRHPDSTETSGPLNVWFVDEIEGNSGNDQFGIAWVGANGVLISDNILGFGPNGRTDTLAHEIGHNLGLRHSSAGGNSTNLLADGDTRLIPSTVADIGPDGAGLSNLTAAQIQEILNSPLVSRSNTGTAGQEIQAADHLSTDHVHLATDHHHLSTEQHHLSTDHVHLSADQVTQLINRLAVLEGTANGTGSWPPDAAITAQLPSSVGRAVPEPAGILGLSIIGISLVAGARRKSSTNPIKP